MAEVDVVEGGKDITTFGGHGMGEMIIVIFTLKLEPD